VWEDILNSNSFGKLMIFDDFLYNMIKIKLNIDIGLNSQIHANRTDPEN
jgi:hypothetical protein